MNKSVIEFNKYNDFSSWYSSILAKADIIDKRYPVKGMYVFTQTGWYLHQKIMDLIELEWEKQDIQKVQFPLLIPESFLKTEADHLAGFTPEVFWVDSDKSGDKTALRPTSETAMYNMFSLWLDKKSYKELPLKVHQSCAVYRYETKDTMPLIRAREIHWNEVHTCHTTEVEAIQNLENAWTAYNRVFDELGIYGLRLVRPVWDKFAGSEYTEVLDCVLPSGKVLQTVGAHYLGQKFAKAFDVKFTNKENQSELAYMTCYGVSTRVLACAISMHSDSYGLVLPTVLAKYHLAILSANNKPEILEKCKNISKLLPNIEHLIDDSDKTLGSKHYNHELNGIPFRVVVGHSELEHNKLTFINRIDRTKTILDIDDQLELKLAVLLVQYDLQLKENSKSYLYSKVVTCRTIEEMKICLADGGFVRVPYYSDQIDGITGDKQIKESTGGEIRGFIKDEVIVDELCVLTGVKAKCWAYVAKSY